LSSSKKNSRANFDYRIKQAGQLASKMRLLAAPWLGLLRNDVWLRNATHSITMARRLAERLRREAKIEAVLPVESSAVFVRLADSVVKRLHECGWHFYKFVEPDVYRFMSSWATSDADIDQLVTDLLR
jgi:threonine aldolase